MVDALKKLDKKFLIIAGCIIGLPIVLIIFLALIQSCGSSKLTYEKYEDKMISSAEKYFKDKDMIPTEEAQLSTVKLSELVSDGYIKSTESSLDDETCDGFVNVRRNGSSREINNGGYLSYTVSLNCKDYNTVHLVDKIKENITTTESGLYQVGEDLIFKGDKVNNYVNFFGSFYRIVSIDKNNVIKLVKSEPDIASRVWDNKYNSDVDHSYGKNIYKDSIILEYLISDYENNKKVSKKARPHIVAYNTCIGKRDMNDNSISKEIDCSEVLENQLVSLLNVSDFALASLDPDCNSTISRSCRNYNYLSDVAVSTWTPNSVSNNSYEVFYLADGLSTYQNANSYNEYNMVIYIDGNELYTSGSGSSSNPYVIE